MRFERVLIAIDASPLAARAAQVGIELAHSLTAQIGFVHVIDHSLYFGPESGVAADELARQARQDRNRLFAEIRSQLPVGTEALEFTTQGSPGPAIVEAAREWGADIIVIGSHGRRGITRALVGSVAESVMRQARCPVLVVRVIN